MTALKQAEAGGGYILRLFNHLDTAVSCQINIPKLSIDKRAGLGPYEVATYHITQGKIEKTSLMEGMI
jgi:hypothetical protein